MVLLPKNIGLKSLTLLSTYSPARPQNNIFHQGAQMYLFKCDTQARSSGYWVMVLGTQMKKADRYNFTEGYITACNTQQAGL